MMEVGKENTKPKAIVRVWRIAPNHVGISVNGVNIYTFDRERMVFDRNFFDFCSAKIDLLSKRAIELRMDFWGVMKQWRDPQQCRHVDWGPISRMINQWLGHEDIKVLLDDATAPKDDLGRPWAYVSEDFRSVLHSMKHGGAAARKEWAESGAYLTMEGGDNPSIFFHCRGVKSLWMPKQEDILASDWMVTRHQPTWER